MNTSRLYEIETSLLKPQFLFNFCIVITKSLCEQHTVGHLSELSESLPLLNTLMATQP